MKYNIYFTEDGIRRLVKRDVDGEEVRKFMLTVSRDEIKHVELERIRDEEER